LEADPDRDGTTFFNMNTGNHFSNR